MKDGHIHGETVRFLDHPDHETIWAIAAGPGDLIQVGVCCEAKAGGTAQVYSYDTRTRELHHVLDVAKAINEDPADGHASHGKIHFSLCPASDGSVYAATHCTTPPLGDDIWDARKMWNHPQKSFTGGHLFRYRPDTGDCTDFGILYPNQGISALVLDEPTGRLAGITYPGARLFVIDPDGAAFTDLGRVSADYPLCLILDGKGHAWTSDTYGYLIRVDLTSRRFDMLSARLPAPTGATGMAASMSDGVMAPDGHIYCVGYAVPDLFRFKPSASGPVSIECLGPFLPGRQFTRGLTFGHDKCLYACAYSPYDPEDKPCLGRMDLDSLQAEPVACLDIDGAPRRYWRAVTGSDGRIYAGECARRPVSLIVLDPTDGVAKRDTLAEPAGKQVDIVSVHGLRTRQSALAMRRYMTIYDASVRRGSVYGIGLAWPPPALLPLEDAAVTGLGVSPDGDVWASTSGAQAHLLWMRKPLQVTHAGPIPGCRRTASRLVFDREGQLYGASRDPGGELFTCDAEAGVFFKYINAPAAIRTLGPVFENDGIACLAISADGTTLAGVGDRSGCAFLFDIQSGTRTILDGSGTTLCPIITSTPGGGFHTARASGEIIHLSHQGDFNELGAVAGMPVSLCPTKSGRLAVGTEAGAMFLVDPTGGSALDCGRPGRIPRLASLVETNDGRIFGVAGREDDLTHLVVYSPATGQWEDLELLACQGDWPWTAYRIGALAVGIHGEIIAGEDDRFGHLFIYHPVAAS
ncbi:hypothetical protein ACFLSJ_03170 [Verrucomicrobiota bacterium]